MAPDDTNLDSISDDGYWQLREGEWVATEKQITELENGAPSHDNVSVLSDDGFWKWENGVWVPTKVKPVKNINSKKFIVKFIKLISIIFGFISDPVESLRESVDDARFSKQEKKALRKDIENRPIHGWKPKKLAIMISIGLVGSFLIAFFMSDSPVTKITFSIFFVLFISSLIFEATPIGMYTRNWPNKDIETRNVDERDLIIALLLSGLVFSLNVLIISIDFGTEKIGIVDTWYYEYSGSKDYELNGYYELTFEEDGTLISSLEDDYTEWERYSANILLLIENPTDSYGIMHNYAIKGNVLFFSVIIEDESKDEYEDAYLCYTMVRASEVGFFTSLDDMINEAGIPTWCKPIQNDPEW